MYIMKRQVLFLSMTTFFALNALAQTPYDNFAPEQSVKPIIEMPKMHFKVANTNLNSEIRSIEFDKNTLSLNLLNESDSVLKSITLNPNDKKFTSIDPLTEKYYHISPWGLSWDDENYYLVGFDSEAGIIKHYRVDKMLHITMSDEPREGKERFEKFDLAAYAKKSFGMYSGKEQKVKLYMENQLAGVIVDRFGKDVMMRPVDETHFTALVDVAVSRQFIHWVFALGDGAKIVGPEEVVEFAQEEIRRLQKGYFESPV